MDIAPGYKTAISAILIALVAANNFLLSVGAPALPRDTADALLQLFVALGLYGIHAAVVRKP